MKGGNEMNEANENAVIPEQPKKPSAAYETTGLLYDFVEMLGVVAVILMLIFSFVVRLNIVDGSSMVDTLHDKEYVVVAELGYKPVRGDIVVVDDQTATPYDHPIVKRVIATGGQTVDIDFTTWTLTVDGEVVDESAYRHLEGATLTSDYPFPITVPEGRVFVLGDNRNKSADSRQIEIGCVDERCVVGKAVARIFPLKAVTLFKNPYEA